MTEAMCWQLESKVTAEYAYSVRTTFELACYCPYESCLAKVYPKQRINTYFYAPDKHVTGCPNEAPSTESSLNPAPSKPRPVDVQARPIPNILGPGPTIEHKPCTPTKEELLQLAAIVKTRPALHPGTLGTVIEAWVCTTPYERATQPLVVAGRSLTYATAFTFLGSATDDIDTLNILERIVFGAATVVDLEHCCLVESRKKFLHGVKRSSLRVVLKKPNLSSDHLPVDWPRRKPDTR